MLAQETRQRIGTLLTRAGDDARHRLAANVAAAVQTAATFAPGAERDAFLGLLDALADLCGTAPPVAGRGGDHDYESLFKLCRSIQFSWSPWIAEPARRDAAAMGPHIWGVAEIMAATAPGQAFRLIEIGCGTGAFGYDVACRRPAAEIVQADISLESLVFAALLEGGTRLTLPRRVDFAISADGIGWFAVAPPPPARPPEFTLESLPALAAGAADFVVAINAFSLFDDPAAGVADAVRLLAPGGHLLWIDLLSWRAETPLPRRIAGPKGMAAIVTKLGLEIRNQVGGIPYLENWGHERCYDWRSHMLLARRGDG